MAHEYFSRGTFDFLDDLKQNNDRAWFAANQQRYEDFVRRPALRFIEDFGPQLRTISGHFRATPRSLYRIHRDVRFSRDKRPYKTIVGLHFRHEQSRTAHAPGYYLHIEPGNVFIGFGMWRPESKALRAVREHIVDEPEAWGKALGAFLADFELAGDRLSRGPRGFDRDHPLIEHLKWKDYIAVRPLAESFVTERAAPRELAALLRPGSAFMAFLCAAVGVPF